MALREYYELDTDGNIIGVHVKDPEIHSIPVNYKTGGNEVRLQGMVSNGAANTVIFNLPSGYRPAKNEIFWCANADSSSYQGARVYVYAGGNVMYERGGATGWLSLSSIVFRAGN